ncbi:MAG: hypothetical protein M0P71_00150 [Melioribacteraceae bacterium]|nr:hypothetical protein [Melioribacteraceae bacterium]
MKTSKMFFVIALFFISTFAIKAVEPNKSKVSNDFNQVEKNLIVGLNSDNEGLKSSSAYYLGEYRAENAVLPLMAILKSNQKDCQRVAAALSLIKINDPRGVFAVKRAAIFDDSEYVRRLCSKFYAQSVKENSAN